MFLNVKAINDVFTNYILTREKVCKFFQVNADDICIIKSLQSTAILYS